MPIFFLSLTLAFFVFSGRRWDGLMVKTLRCGRSDPGSIPGLNKSFFLGNSIVSNFMFIKKIELQMGRMPSPY